MTYPDKELVITTLNTVAKYMALESSATHPEDIASVMSMAVEVAGKVLDTLTKAGHLTSEPPF